MKSLVIFASGSGTNAANIIQHFKNHPKIRVDSVWSNKKDAYVLQRAADLGIETLIFSRDEFKNPRELVAELQRRGTDLIVLAGFLWLVPPELIDAFTIINIHPALLPAYGGKGMYGSYVHESVIRNNEKESGITIHLVNKVYDEGEPILQVKCPVLPSDSPETLAARVHELEYEYFPRAIEEFLSSDQGLRNRNSASQ